MSIADVGQSTQPEKKGLVDGPHIILKCSSCGEELVDLWQVKPGDEADPEFTFVAECWCGDRSFPQKIRGSCYPGAIGYPDPKDPENQILKTQLVDFVTMDNYILIKVAQVK